MIPKYLVKSIDAVVFGLFIFIGNEYIATNPRIFDVVVFTAMLYVVLRKLDVNTITLVLIVLSVELVSHLLSYLYNQMPYTWYITVIVVDLVTAASIWKRSILIGKYGPAFVKYNEKLTVTRQDSLMALLFILHAGFYLVRLLEHILRHLDDIGLEGLFGDWKPMLVYDNFQSGQFAFTILELVILYFMTFNKSKKQLKARQYKTQV